MGVDANPTRLALKARKDFFGSDQVDLYGKGNASLVCHFQTGIPRRLEAGLRSIPPGRGNELTKRASLSTEKL